MADIDETKMSIALNNLIENAIKYNYDDGWVRVTLNADHKFFYVTVQDSGVGIPEDVQDNVFERFYRVDKARSRDTGGTRSWSFPDQKCRTFAPWFDQTLQQREGRNYVYCSYSSDLCSIIINNHPQRSRRYVMQHVYAGKI